MMPSLSPQYPCARSATKRKYPIGHVLIAAHIRDGKLCLLKRYPDCRKIVNSLGKI